MYKSVLLQLTLVALTLSMIGGTPLKQQIQKRFILDSAADAFKTLGDQVGKAVDGVTDYFSDSDEDQASGDAMALGQEMIDRGKTLLQLAANLSQRAYDEVRDPENKKIIKAAIDRMTNTANDVVNAGKTVVQNKGKITAAIQQSLQNLKSVAKDSIAPLQDSLNLTKDSIKKAGPALVAAGISAKDSAVALGAALKEMVETSDLIAKANRHLDAVGRNLWGFGKGLYNAGRNIGISIGDAAKTVAKASGLWGQGNSE
ncbi:hypothetical protein ElyMa_005094000 [Elysia marginata]|uniref:Uncharacterized protein n=1 Tax=Elysia marginata TaxID=1093978 RepID=A0AAV4JJE4_9GAST|nr:hypothetical protein ElyMa_005094000 [Elysia marginata]